MKALVLSGGSGTRLRPISHSMPKQLIPIANRPLLELVLENIATMGVTDVGIVVGGWAAEIQAVIGDGARFGMRVTYIRQDAPLGLADCVRVARPFLGDDDFVMYLGDVLLGEGVRDIAECFLRDRPAAQVLVQKVADPACYGIVELASDDSVIGLVEKPTHPNSDLALVGVYFFTAAVHEAVAAIGPSARGELEITDAVQWLLAHGRPVRATRYSGFWKDTGGRPEDILECTSRLLSEQRRRISGAVDAATEVVGSVVVEAGARVVRSRIEGPVIIGAGSVVEDSRLGPDVAIGRNCLIRATRLANSVVMDGASVSAAPGLVGSVIGRGAVVSRGGDGSAHHRLVVGDHTQVEIAA